MLTESKSPKSTYLPTTIWLTVFAGIGEKPGPTTNGCWRSGPDGKFAAKVLLLSGTGTEAPAVIDVLKICERGVAKVAIKDGTGKLGLPCVVEGGKVPPEAKKDAVCCDRLGGGAGTPPEAACGSMLTRFPRKLLKLGPGPVSATNEAYTASTIAAIRVGSGGPTATTGAETVEGVWDAEFPQKRVTKDQPTTRLAGRNPITSFPPPNWQPNYCWFDKQSLHGSKTAGYCKNTLRRTASKPLRI